MAIVDHWRTQRGGYGVQTFESLELFGIVRLQKSKPLYTKLSTKLC